MKRQGTGHTYPAFPYCLDPLEDSTSFARCERRAAVVNESFMDGKVTSYLRRQWFCNVVLFCPIFTGHVPLSHNTAVEVSYKIKKHHTEIGLNARQRKGMAVEEYVKETGLACKK